MKVYAAFEVHTRHLLTDAFARLLLLTCIAMSCILSRWHLSAELLA